MKRYRVNLVQLQDICAQNYRHILCMVEYFSDSAVQISPVFSWTLRPLSAHTWIMDVLWNTQTSELGRPVWMRVHVYHDAQLAEVVQIHKGQLRIPAVQNYPNLWGQSADEKQQMNVFFGELLSVSLKHYLVVSKLALGS